MPFGNNTNFSSIADAKKACNFFGYDSGTEEEDGDASACGEEFNKPQSSVRHLFKRRQRCRIAAVAVDTVAEGRRVTKNGRALIYADADDSSSNEFVGSREATTKVVEVAAGAAPLQSELCHSSAAVSPGGVGSVRQRDENRSVTASEPRPPSNRARGLSVEQLLRRLDPRSLRSSGPRRTPRPTSAKNCKSVGAHSSGNAPAFAASTAAAATTMHTARLPIPQVTALMQHQHLLRCSEPSTLVPRHRVRALPVPTPRSANGSSQTQRGLARRFIPTVERCCNNVNALTSEPSFPAETWPSVLEEGVMGRSVAKVQSAHGPVCVICLEELRSEADSGACRQRSRSLPLTALACGHSFHASCIRQWLEASPTCPLCKVEVVDSHGRAMGGGNRERLDSPASLEVRGIAPPMVRWLEV